MSCSIHPDDHDELPSTFIVAEWMPLDELSRAFGEFGAEATSALALQAVGSAFAALAFEVSAHKHYTLAYHGLWGHVPSTVVQGLEHALADLKEAITQWGTVALWFEKLGEQEPAQLDTLRFHFDPLIQDHTAHLWNLQVRLRQEHESMRTRLPQSVQEGVHA